MTVTLGIIIKNNQKIVHLVKDKRRENCTMNSSFTILKHKLDFGILL